MYKENEYEYENKYKNEENQNLRHEREKINGKIRKVRYDWNLRHDWIRTNIGTRPIKEKSLLVSGDEY